MTKEKVIPQIRFRVLLILGNSVSWGSAFLKEWKVCLMES